MKHEFFSDVKEGKLQQNVRKLIADLLPSFNDKRVRVTIERLTSKRSLQENRYYFGCVVPEEAQCFKEMWGEIYNKERVHLFNHNMFFYDEMLNEKTGEIIKIPRSSASYKVSEFELKMEEIRQYFELNFDWKISLPNEQKQMPLK